MAIAAAEGVAADGFGPTVNGRPPPPAGLGADWLTWRNMERASGTAAAAVSTVRLEVQTREGAGDGATYGTSGGLRLPRVATLAPATAAAQQSQLPSQPHPAVFARLPPNVTVAGVRATSHAHARSADLSHLADLAEAGTGALGFGQGLGHPLSPRSRGGINLYANTSAAQVIDVRALDVSEGGAGGGGVLEAALEVPSRRHDAALVGAFIESATARYERLLNEAVDEEGVGAAEGRLAADLSSALCALVAQAGAHCRERGAAVAAAWGAAGTLCEAALGRARARAGRAEHSAAAARADLEDKRRGAADAREAAAADLRAEETRRAGAERERDAAQRRAQGLSRRVEDLEAEGAVLRAGAVLGRVGALRGGGAAPLLSQTRLPAPQNSVERAPRSRSDSGNAAALKAAEATATAAESAAAAATAAGAADAAAATELAHQVHELALSTDKFRRDAERATARAAEEASLRVAAEEEMGRLRRALMALQPDRSSGDSSLEQKAERLAVSIRGLAPDVAVAELNKSADGAELVGAVLALLPPAQAAADLAFAARAAAEVPVVAAAVAAITEEEAVSMLGSCDERDAATIMEVMSSSQAAEVCGKLPSEAVGFALSRMSPGAAASLVLQVREACCQAHLGSEQT